MPTPLQKYRPTRTWDSAVTEKEGSFVDAGAHFMPGIDYGFGVQGPNRWPRLPVNPSGGLLACGHPVGATGLMQAVLAFWQLQGIIGKHLGDATLQTSGRQTGPDPQPRGHGNLYHGIDPGKGLKR
jgi:hypothetical protein